MLLSDGLDTVELRKDISIGFIHESLIFRLKGLTRLR